MQGATARDVTTPTPERYSPPSRRSPALYVAVQAQRVVILRVFIKKTEKTPRHEIELALSCAKLIKTTEK